MHIPGCSSPQDVCLASCKNVPVLHIPTGTFMVAVTNHEAEGINLSQASPRETAIHWLQDMRDI